MSTLTHLFKHNLWSNLRLLDACAALPDEQLDGGSDGTYGSIRATLLHLLGAEERYVTLLQGEPRPDPPLERRPFPGFEGLREGARTTGERLIALGEEMAGETVVRGSAGDELFAVHATVPLMQAIHHAHEHRTQITTMLGQLGIEPPDLSGWKYGEVHGMAEWGPVPDSTIGGGEDAG